MRSVFEWFSEHSFPDARAWLVLGKGPSFALRGRYDLSQFHLLSLNHAVREERVLLAHLIDFDVVQQVGDALARNASFVVMPWVPHVKNVPGPSTLSQLADATPVLDRLRSEGRLLWYNLANAPPDKRRAGSPLVTVRYFSIEAALNILALAGVRRVRSLGIDGGSTYASAFQDLTKASLLTNRRTSFDVQFAEIARTIFTAGIDYAPLHLESPIRVYVGTREAQMLATRVLEYSIKKRTSMTTEVFPLHRAPIEIPLPKDPHNHPRTPFTFQRFIIPALAGRRGHAVYLDSDMLVLRDMRLLWSLPFDRAQVLTARDSAGVASRAQFSVMLLDCESLDWDIRSIVAALDEGRLSYDRLVYEMAIAPKITASIPSEWNSLEHYERRRTCLLHFTDMNRQPWLTIENPLAYLWARELLDAIRVGFISMDEVRENVARGYVRPSLRYQVENGIDDAYRSSLSLLLEARRLDTRWRSPAGNHIVLPLALWKALPRLAIGKTRQWALQGARRARAVSVSRIGAQPLRQLRRRGLS